MHQKNPRSLPLAAIASMFGLAASAALPAQEAGPNANQLQEVVITAEKRTSTVQDTPISITAVTGQDLQDRGITDLTGIVNAVPGISMRQNGPGQTELEMRGMTSAGGNSSTVGFYLDDTPLSAPAAAQNGKVVIDPDLYDLNRVEVLRGPQGTLYGSGSMGGTIRLIPNAPDPKAFAASGEVILGGTDGGSFNHGENAMLNIPLASDIAALRLVGTQDHQSGWIDRIVIAYPDWPNATANVPGGRGNVAAAPIAKDYKGVNDEDLTTFRAALLVNPIENLTITPSFMYQRITSEGLSQIDSTPGTNTNYQPYDNPEPFSDRIDIGALNISYHAPWFDATSVSSYWTRDEDLRMDGTEQIATVIGTPVYPPGGFGPTTPTTLEDDKSWQFTQEVRLASNNFEHFKWLLGYFYQDFESDWDLFVPTPLAVPLTGTSNGFLQYQPTKIIQNAFFGEVSWEFLPKLTGTVGLRRFDYTGTVYTAVSGWLSSSGGDTVDHFISSEKDQGVTPKFDLSYQMDKDLMLYGTASKGFRPGGGNQPIPTADEPPLGPKCNADLESIGVFGGAPLGFKPDTVWSYEIGEKFRSDSGTVTLNSAAYFEHWENIQQEIPLACGFPFTGNLGSAKVYGGEAELDALVMPGLLFMVNAGLSRARFTSNPAASITTIDNRVQDVPDWTGAASLAYRTPISERLNFISRADYSYVGSRIDVTAGPNYLPSYDLVNLRAGIEGSDGHWNAVAFVNNVANKVAKLTDTSAINVNVFTFNRIAVAPPLTFGVDVNYRFNGGR